MSTVEIPVGTTASPRVLYMEESATPKRVEAKVVVRDWDVTDPEARRTAAIEELGYPTEHHANHAKWFIDEGRNAAALCLFRPKPDGSRLVHCEAEGCEETRVRKHGGRRLLCDKHRLEDDA